MIESIHIRNFRGIQTGHLDRFRQFNLLVGPNNAGKSTLLEALYLAGTTSRDATLSSTIRGTRNTEKTVTYEVTVTAPDLLRHHPLSQVWSKHGFAGRQPGLGRRREERIFVRVPDRDFPLSAFELLTGGDGFVQGEEEVTGLIGIEATDLNQEQGVEGLVEEMMGPDVLPFTDQRLLFLWHSELTYNRKGSAAWLVAGELPTAQRVFFFDVEGLQANLPLNFYQEMLGSVPGWSHRIARHFGAIFDIAKPFAVQFIPPRSGSPSMQGYIAPEDGLAMSIDTYGDGARSAFKVLTPLVALAELAREGERGLFLWEEPELFQNPQTLGRLLATVIEIVKGRPIQVFISTQSLEVIGHLANMVQEEQLENDALVAFRLDLTAGKLRSSRFEPRHLLAWLSDGLDPRVWEPLLSPVQYRLQEETV